MTILTRVSNSLRSTRLNVIFIHGIDGDIKSTWESRSAPRDLWIKWLSYDLKDVSVWSVGYPTAKTRWRSESGMAISDRALNILEKILATDDLKHAEIALVGHSAGGLVIKQIMRTANSMAPLRVDAAEFQMQVRRIAFLATPHAGTGQASLLDKWRIFAKPSAATVEIVRNSSTLRELNLWYRDWSASKEISHLILVETQPTKNWGLLVPQDSSDPGLLSRPVPVDADHYSISKPDHREDIVYVLLKKFFQESPKKIHPDKVVVELLEDHSLSFEDLKLGQKQQLALLRAVAEKDAVATDPKVISLIDAEINERLILVRKCRFFPEFNRKAEVEKFGSEIVTGGYIHGSSVTRAKALAWCSRMLADNDNSEKVKILLAASEALANTEEAEVSKAFILRLEGKYNEALSMLSKYETPLSRSAMFMIEQQQNGPEPALKWAEMSGIRFETLDGDGKFIWLNSLARLGNWGDAESLVSKLVEPDFEYTPILLFTAALATLQLAVPEELREHLETHIPFELDTFPLNDDAKSMERRSKSSLLFERACHSAANLACDEMAKLASDYHVWLLLRDDRTKSLGLKLLRESLDRSEFSLRRVNFALRFDLNLDFSAVEREIEKQHALSGGRSLDAALARLVLTLHQSNPHEVLRYLATHRAQLNAHIATEMLNGIEIQALAAAGQLEEAERRVTTLINSGVGDDTAKRYRMYIRNAVKGDAGVESRIAQYKETNRLADLAILVEVLLKQKDWDRLVPFAKSLFLLTNSISDAETVVIALENVGDFMELDVFLRENSELVERSNLLLSSWSWTLYRAGDFNEARNVLGKLLSLRDNSRDRSLEINIAIASGTWESLAALAEKHWEKRQSRTAEELIYVARVAQNAGAPRARDLMQAAVAAAPTDPNVLISGYILATEAGWEVGETTASWLTTAAENSGEEGPVRHLSLEEIVKLQPDWNARAIETFGQLLLGEIPTFLAAKMLNRTLLDLVLANGIANASEVDPRRRSVISAFSGARRISTVNGKRVAIDATAVLTLGRLDLLDKLKNTFSLISVPHSMFALLFEESKKVQFHQPSQIKRAMNLRQLVSLAEFTVAGDRTIAEPDLILEVGDELASLISEVVVRRSEEGENIFVVTSFPVTRAGSLRQEEVDLSAYSPIFCDAVSVLRKVVRFGRMTIAEQKAAISYLKMQGQADRFSVDLPDNSTLYFDDITTVHLYHAGVLKHLKSCGLKIVLSSASIAHADALIQRQDSVAEQLEIINRIKKYLEEGILNGEIVVSAMIEGRNDADYAVVSHPSFSVMHDANDKDCLLIDERFLNHHSNLANEAGENVPIITSLDVLGGWRTGGLMTESEYHAALTTLRRACYFFIPVEPAELHSYLTMSEVQDGVLIENTELKCVREYLIKIRMSNVIKLPQEGLWLEDVMRTFIEVLKSQWQTAEEVTAAARSNWLWRQVDALRWASVLPTDAIFANALQQFKMQHMALILGISTESSKEQRQSYWRWLEREVINPLKAERPELYREILEWCQTSIEKISENIYQVDEE